MENTDQHIAAPEKEQKTSPFMKAIEILTFPVSGLAGLWTTHISIRNDAQEVAKAPDLFLHKTFTDYQKVRVKHDHLRETNAITKQEWQALDTGSRNAYRAILDAKMEEHGLGTFMSKWNYVSRSARQKAVIEGMGVAMVAVGALLSITNSKFVQHMFDSDTKGNER